MTDSHGSPKFQIFVTSPTVIKKRPLQSSVLSNTDFFPAAVNTRFDCNTCIDSRDHWQFRLASDYIKIWYIFKKHCVVTDISYPLAETKPASIRLNVPYKSQLDNEENPTGSCNVTSLAMALEFLDPDLKGGYKQLEDHLYRLMENNGLSRHSPQDLARVVNDFYYPLKDDFTILGSFERCRNHLAMGFPCVIHGYFTAFGHIVTLAGYDTTGFFVHDPYGEWFSNGYDTARSGAFLHYSYTLISQVCMPDDQFWVHYIKK